MELSVIRTLGLLCLSHLCLDQVAGLAQNCSGNKFDVYDGETKVTGFPCTLYGSQSCSNGPAAFPGGLGEGISVEKPLDFRASAFQRNVTYGGHVYRASGVQFEWKGPVSGSSREGIKGYYLKVVGVNSGKVICRLFDLQSLGFNSTNLRFGYELYPFTDSVHVTYIIELFSLPPPTDAEVDSGLYERYVVSLPPLHDFNKTREPTNPKDWTTAVLLRLAPAGGSVEVRFSFPEEGSLAQFDSYRVVLLKKGTTNQAFEANVTHNDREEFGSYVFKNVPEETYKILITPNDAYRNDDDKCQCYEIGKPPLPSRLCSSKCKTTETEYFNVLGLEPTTSSEIPTTVKSSSFPSIEMTSGESTDGKVGEVSGGVVAAAVLASLVLAGLVVVFCVCWRRRKNQQYFSDGDKANNNNNSADNKYNCNGLHPYFIPSTMNNFGKELKVPQLSRKSILLLASEDHKCFSQALEKFAQFLELHCQCDVTFAPQQLPCLRKTANSYCWLSSKIDSADYVIIVTSVAASHLYNAFQEGYAYKEADFGPEGDLFTPGIQHICGKIANNEDVRRVIMVHFKHTSPSLRLPIAALPSRHYHLPNHLSSFLLHIHELDENKMDLSKVNLPLQGNVEELKGGKEWLSAVQEAKAFERSNPGWFDQKFGKRMEIVCKPGYTTQDSGYGEGHSRLSGFSERRLSSISSYGAADQSVREGIVNEGFTKHDFTAPSEVLSAYTVPYPDFGYMGADRPLEIDQGSSISDQLREFNERYELDRQLEQQQQHLGVENIPQEERSAVCEQTNSPHADQFMYLNCADVHLEIPHHDGDLDCISVSSAQSV